MPPAIITIRPNEINVPIIYTYMYAAYNVGLWGSGREKLPLNKSWLELEIVCGLGRWIDE